MSGTERPYLLRTEVTITLGQPFPSNDDTIIFKAYAHHGVTRDRLEIFDDIRGVLERVKSHGLIEVPDSFETKEEGYAFWRNVLATVNVEWDHADLTPGNTVRLTFPGPDGTVVALSEWNKPQRMQFAIQRSYILEPNPQRDFNERS